MTKKHTLSLTQDDAANPQKNVWVQANAGTGKTSVLVHRLLRILFRSQDFKKDRITSGVLCLTYTNAGASEMRNRILASLRAWAIASDEELKDLLESISYNKKPNEEDLEFARKMFYKYIDNPDILKVKTIHGFCEEILKRFPVEAGVSPSWNLVSDDNQKNLLSQTFERLINSPIKEDDKSSVLYNKRVEKAFSYIVDSVSEHSFDALLKILTSKYKVFFDIENYDSYREYFIENTRLFLNLDEKELQESSKEIIKNVIANTENDRYADKDRPNYLTNVINLSKQYIDNAIDFEEYKSAYLTKDDTKRSHISKKEYLTEEQDKIYEINQRKINEEIFKSTVSMFDLSHAFSNTYRSLKEERNLLDFDDLILYTRRLFDKPDYMGWVLSQLDLSLTHILLDEAQDTSPQQWDILRILSGDFFTEGNNEQETRSLFIVGDTKQSIYGFQGADPEAFINSRHKISSQISSNLRTIDNIPLNQSFRSTKPILEVVDFFFGDENIKAISKFNNSEHKCFREKDIGLVEIHPIYSSKTKE